MVREISYPLSTRSAATRLAMAFVLWSGLWVVGSDYLLHLIVPPAASWSLQTEKGLIYVVISGLLLWLSVRAMQSDEEGRRALNESKLRRLNESGLIAVAGRTGDGRLCYANETFTQMVGYTYYELMGISVSKLVPKQHAWLREKVERELHEFGQTSLLEVELLRKDGSLVPVLGGRATLASSNGEEIDYFVDITALKRDEKERERLKELLLQSEKLNALGQLAGGVAHNFNNELAVILGYASLLDGKLNGNPGLREETVQIMRAGERARRLIKQLLAFSRKQPLHREIIDLNQVVLEMRAMFKPLLKENIELRLQTSKRQECIEIDISHLQQIVTNLVINARDAMPDGGILTLAIESAGNASQGADSRVVLKVSDTGLGMDESVKRRIFEPFFTTKQQTGGTGLGLATVHGFVQDSNGEISVTTKPGEGTTFVLEFPRVESKVSEAAPDQAVAHGRVSATVLLAEDLDDLRSMLTEVLELKGLRVLPASNGADAVRIATDTHEKIDLIVTDVTMPRMTGPEAVKTIRKVRPSLRAIYLSGYADSVTPDEGDVLMAKPVLPDVLISTIQSCLTNGLPRPHRRQHAA